MPTGAAIGAGAVVGGVISSRGARKSAETQADAITGTAAQSEALNRERYKQAEEYLSPYIDRERLASDQLLFELGLSDEGLANTSYMQSPGYRRSMDALDLIEEEGIDAVNQGAANTGSLYSGRRGEALRDVGAGTQLARAQTENQFYNNYMNILQNLGTPASTTNLSSLGVNQAATIGSQNIAAQNTASGYALQGTAAQNAAYADAFGGVANLGAAYLSSPHYAYNSGAQGVPINQNMANSTGTITPNYAYL